MRIPYNAVSGDNEKRYSEEKPEEDSGELRLEV